MQILVAEDDAVNQMVFLHRLEKLGYRADIAGNGLEVLDALRRQHYDVVFVDHHMPEMDGLTATQTIRSEWTIEDQPWIILLSAMVWEGDRERFLEAGVDDYLPSKPLMMEDLDAALQQAAQKMAKGQTLVYSTLETDGESSPQETHEPIDETGFLNRLGEGTEPLLYQWVARFLEEAPNELAKFKLGLLENDHDAVYTSIFILSGSSAVVSATVFDATCQEILELLRQDVELAAVATYLPSLNQELAAIQQWQQQHSQRWENSRPPKFSSH